MKKKKRKIWYVISIVILTLIFLSYSSKNMKIEEYEKEVYEEWKLSKFDLRDKIDMDIEYQIQATYTSCWAYSALDSIETYITLNYGKKYNFSESYLEYMTSNLLGGDRELNSGGDFYTVQNCIEQGKSIALQEYVPNRIYDESELEILKQAKPVIKRINSVKFDSTESDFIEKIKKHIVKNGAIYSEIFFLIPKLRGESNEYFNYETKGFCNLMVPELIHTAEIIGWDDNYSKENFPKENRPEEDGAYIVNCYWKNCDCIIYISYEDICINKNMIGITSCELY